jgi:hypothetical protein
MPEEPHEFFKSREDPMPTDAFHGAAFQVFYDADGHVEYIELSASDEIEPLFGGRPVLTMPADGVVESIARQTPFDDTDPDLGYSYVFPALDLALWRPTLPEHDEDEEGRTFSTIGVGRPGYFARP